MPRALFQKNGNAIYTSHLDLMRLFQRAFKRAGLPLTHTQGFNPRPSVSIAMPLSLGVDSCCELLDFELEGAAIPNEEILERLNQALIDGVRVLQVYDEMRKIKHIAYLDCIVRLEYDSPVPADAVVQIQDLFRQEEILVDKKSKNGVVSQNIRPMIRKLEVHQDHPQTIQLVARVCCQNPSLNPMQLSAAIEKYLPELKPDFVSCSRVEIYDQEEKVFR